MKTTNMQPFIQKNIWQKRFIAKLWQPSPTDLAPPFKPTLPPKLTINIAKEKDLKFSKTFSSGLGLSAFCDNPSLYTPRSPRDRF
ncbi:hypothetical protein CDAR_116971 [Caerostris darwini]|uniref:Uncharacterized protein n=1 Tax=Caerostris darwini TaxID=1538125 RepID=A0AAV4W930_9ARAC|nr:hypothetical protein CDAR_116971 [Caerostris darwini]